MKQDYDYDELKVAKKVLLVTSFDNAKREKHPIAIILGGQPASGKTQLFEYIQNNIYPDKQFVVINGDEYRSHHPRSIDIEIEHGKNYADKTQPFANDLVKFMKEECIKKRYNFILESTFRNIGTIKNTSEELKKDNYKTAVHALSVSYWDSILGIFERYEGQIKAKGFGRFSPITTHNEAFTALPKNLKSCLQEQLYDEIFIYKRTSLGLEGIKVNSVSDIDAQMEGRLPISNPGFYKDKFENILQMARTRVCLDSDYLKSLKSIIELIHSYTTDSSPQT
jgi:UDP-N-acetylglucosamine kinase